MRIKNLSSTSQELTMIEIVGGQGIPISIEAKGSTEIPTGFYVDFDKLDKRFLAVEGHPSPKNLRIPEDLDLKVTTEEASQEVVPPDEVIAPEDDETAPVIGDKFICEICKAEFASARGLNSHLTRAHSGENK